MSNLLDFDELHNKINNSSTRNILKLVIDLLISQNKLLMFLDRKINDIVPDVLIEIINLINSEYPELIINDDFVSRFAYHNYFDRFYKLLPVSPFILNFVMQYYNTDSEMMGYYFDTITINPSYFKYKNQKGKNLFHYITKLSVFIKFEEYFNPEDVFDIHNRSIVQSLIVNEADDNLIKYIVDKYGLVDSIDSFGETILFTCIYNNKTDLLDFFCNFVPDLVNQQNILGETVLYHAILQENYEIYEYLIKKYKALIGSKRCYHIIASLKNLDQIVIDHLKLPDVNKRIKLNYNLIRNYVYINNNYFNKWLFDIIQNEIYLNKMYADIYSKGIGMNLSHCHLEDNKYMFTIRVIIKNEFDMNVSSQVNSNFVRPGYCFGKNDNKKDIMKKYNNHIGENFIWNQWTTGDFFCVTVVFYGFYINGQMTIDHNEKPFICHDIIHDARLYKYGNIICITNSDMKKIQLILDRKHKYTMSGSFNQFFKINDKNLVFLQCFTMDEAYICDFFRNGKFEYVITTDNHTSIRRSINCGEMNSDSNRIFSFGSHFYDIKNNNNNYNNYYKKSFDKLAVGHFKYKNSVDTKDVKLENFRKTLDTKLQNIYGDNYIKHYNYKTGDELHGYTYLMYFIRIKFDPNNLDQMKCYISSAFYPIKLQNDNEFGFSLIFPTGISVHNDIVIVSSGEGDYYNSLIEFDKQKVLEMTNIDIETFTYDNYQYQIIEY